MGRCRRFRLHAHWHAAAYSIAAFFGPLKAEFNAQRGETSLVVCISAFLYFLLGMPIGVIADRLGQQPVVTGASWRPRSGWRRRIRVRTG